MASAGFSGVTVLPVSSTLRSGESCGGRKPSRTGRIRSEVKVWADAPWFRPISTRHAETARKSPARLWRPVAGPDFTIGKLQHYQNLGGEVPSRCGTLSLMELKQLWLMSR